MSAPLDQWTRQFAPRGECYDGGMPLAIIVVSIILAVLVHPLFLLLLLLLLV